MRRSSWAHRQFCRRQAGFFRQLPERISPCKRQEAADQRIQHGKNGFRGRIQIAQGIICRVQAEVNAEREHQLNEASPGFPQLEDGSPENVGQHQPHEIKVLRDLINEVRENLAAGLLEYREGKQRGSRQKKNRTHLNVALSVQLAKHFRVETAQRQEQQDGQQGVRIIIEVGVSERREPVVLQNLKADRAGKYFRRHVDVQEDITPESGTLNRAHHYGRF